MTLSQSQPLPIGRSTLWLALALSACRLGMPDPGTLRDSPSDLGAVDAKIDRAVTDASSDGLSSDARAEDVGITYWDGSTGSGASLKAVWGSREDAVWAVGNGGTVLFWDGAWSEVSAPTTSDIHAVHGTAEGQAWAVGEAGTILHLPGHEQSWQLVTSPVTANLNGVWAVSSSDVWAVGDAGTVVHFAGSTWAPSNQSSEDLLAIWGAAEDDIWVSGNNGLLMHWGGSTAGWKVSTAVTTRSLRGVWGRGSPAKVWAAGPGGTITRYETSWSKTELSSAITFEAIGGVPTVTTQDKVWAAGQQGGDGVIYELVAGNWTLKHTVVSRGLRGVWALPSGHGWVVGLGGTAEHLAP
jgi:hypothetical protein